MLCEYSHTECDHLAQICATTAEIGTESIL